MKVQILYSDCKEQPRQIYAVGCSTRVTGAIRILCRILCRNQPVSSVSTPFRNSFCATSQQSTWGGCREAAEARILLICTRWLAIAVVCASSDMQSGVDCVSISHDVEGRKWDMQL